jgi:hypothetical protein
MIWIILDYFGLYFKDLAFGHPCFLAEQIVQQMLTCEIPESDPLDIDFRLWLTRPHVIIPSTSGSHSGVCIMIEADAGVHYRYKSYGASYSSQDIVAKDIGIVALREFMDSSVSRGRRQVSGCLQSSGAQTLIDGLSFSVQYDFNESANYTKFVICIPLSPNHLDRTDMSGIEPGDINIRPYQCQDPLVCKPFYLPSRDMSEKFTAYFSIEYMKLASELLTAFVGPKLETQEPNLPERQNMYSITAHICGAEFQLSDPVMGMHRPILSISLPSLLLTASQLQDTEPKATKRKSCNLDQLTRASTPLTCDHDLQIAIETIAFIDYFKLGKSRNWEASGDGVMSIPLINSRLKKSPSHTCFTSMIAFS